MKQAIAIMLFWVVPLFVAAAGFKSFLLSADGSRLVVIMADGSRFNAPKLAEQTSFIAPQLSPHGEYVGWLARSRTSTGHQDRHQDRGHPPIIDITRMIG